MYFNLCLALNPMTHFGSVYLQRDVMMGGLVSVRIKSPESELAMRKATAKYNADLIVWVEHYTDEMRSDIFHRVKNQLSPNCQDGLTMMKINDKLREKLTEKYHELYLDDLVDELRKM